MAKEETLPQPVSTMTSAQLARRRRLTDAVIEMIDQVPPEQLQMRDVAERSGVALGTAYRYFSSKDHLLAAAWADWQRRLTDRVRGEVSRDQARVSTGAAPTQGACTRVLAFLHRELRAFQRHPNFARLVAHVESCSDPFASEELAGLANDNQAVMAALMEDVPAEVARPAMTAINATLASGLVSWTAGRLTFPDLVRQLEDVTRLVLGPYDTPTPAGP
ncbi:TetR/AcrR family transcriptional regulator [Frankia sp. CNm7]|uniref:TetR/AcrR family transcriptional regulator n=1 Tax=Frankia nepalensis TaxID=1836974 RepID=A0A937RF96_9ACTN|nr:TetR family transcriptional regulator [Frankia nepalensis]MBL7496219.1 TetR/AcrR family transcriptional regulator [Frankia nepalensis]MBL7511642.1 TetR/AcrR family transcriptional regulator [Frankia nepalensis]MBL7517733.1 TetR/AcrR family transcriptional regulator [Frankia nepalensis]MBL7631116.1 TetR/AcrR family transcriptional regulator [Frankia nepalensis]